tara:strand:- start:366 stop:1622 length:1257 start_codon:yes stop_codon:yes gene_type:complete
MKKFGLFFPIIIIVIGAYFLFYKNDTKNDTKILLHDLEKRKIDNKHFFYYNENLFTGFAEVYYNDEYIEFWKGVRIQDLYQKHPEIFNNPEFLSIANLPCYYEGGDSINYPCTDGAEAPNLFAPLYNAGGPAIANILIDSLDSARLYFDELSKELNNKYLFYLTKSPQEPSSAPNKNYIQIIALDNSDGPVLTGSSVESAQQEYGPLGSYTISLTMTNSGAIKWSNVTAQLQPDPTKNKLADHVAIVLGKEVYSYPTVPQQLNLHSEISGNFDIIEAQNIANTINEKKIKARFQFKDGINIDQSCWDINGNEIECEKQDASLTNIQSKKDIIKDLVRTSITKNSVFIAVLEELNDNQDIDSFIEDFVKILAQKNESQDVKNKIPLMEIFLSSQQPYFENDDQVKEWLKKKTYNKSHLN